MSAEQTPAPLSFADFLDRMKDPSAASLVREIKSFIRQFEERPSGHAVDPEADSALVQAFYSRMEATFRVHPIWAGQSQEVLDQAVEGLEKYLMSKLWPRAFAACREDRDRDERYTRLTTALSFVDLATLMGQEVVPEEALVAAAEAELLKMDRYKAPRDKLLCLVNVKTLVEDIVGAAARGGANVGGADAFFPVFLLVIIRARPPRVASNIEYIKRFRAQRRLSGQFDFMLCQLESASMYLDTVDWKHLRISQEEFLTRLSDAGIPEAEMELRAMRAAAEQQSALLLMSENNSTADASLPAVGTGSVDLLDMGSSEPIQLLNAVPTSMEGGTAVDNNEPPAGEVDSPLAATGTAAVDIGMEAKSLLDTAAAPVEQIPVSSIPLPTEHIEIQHPPVPALDVTFPVGSFTNEGLTPLGGGGPTTPVLLKKREVDTGSSLPLEPPSSPRVLGDNHEAPAESIPLPLPTQEAVQQSRYPVAPSTTLPAPAPAPPPPAMAPLPLPGERVVEAMIVDGTSLVLHEEAEGRLQARHPWIYAAAEDLRTPDVRDLLGAYRDVVLKYEALSLVLQQQLGGAMQGTAGAAGTAWPGGLSPGAGVSAAAGALLNKLASWSRIPSGQFSGGNALNDAEGSEHVAALRGKGAGGGGGGNSGDPGLLHTLFGSPQPKPASKKWISDDVGGDIGSAPSKPATTEPAAASEENRNIDGAATDKESISPASEVAQAPAEPESLI